MTITPAPIGVCVAIETRDVGDARLTLELDTLLMKVVSKESQMDRHEVVHVYLDPAAWAQVRRDYGEQDELLARRLPVNIGAQSRIPTK